MSFQRKIDQVINNKELVLQEITYTDVQKLMESIVWESEEKLEKMGGLHKIIDSIFFGHTRRFFIIQNVIYIVGFVLPFLYAEFSLKN